MKRSAFLQSIYQSPLFINLLKSNISQPSIPATYQKLSLSFWWFFSRVCYFEGSPLEIHQQIGKSSQQCMGGLIKSHSVKCGEIEYIDCSKYWSGRKECPTSSTGKRKWESEKHQSIRNAKCSTGQKPSFCRDTHLMQNHKTRCISRENRFLPVKYLYSQ